MFWPGRMGIEEGAGEPGELHGRKGEVGEKMGSIEVQERWISQGALSCWEGGELGS